VAINLIRGDVLPLSTALVGLPLGGALAALGLAYAKRRTALRAFAPNVSVSRMRQRTKVRRGAAASRP
jgi:hypothetical protein